MGPISTLDGRQRRRGETIAACRMGERVEREGLGSSWHPVVELFFFFENTARGAGSSCICGRAKKIRKLKFISKIDKSRQETKRVLIC